MHFPSSHGVGAVHLLNTLEKERRQSWSRGDIRGTHTLTRKMDFFILRVVDVPVQVWRFGTALNRPLSCQLR